jgi:hypothetical protein
MGVLGRTMVSVVAIFFYLFFSIPSEKIQVNGWWLKVKKKMMNSKELR